MAHVLRTAKSMFEWDSLDLQAYNISVEQASPAAFFGHEPSADVDALAVDPAFLNYEPGNSEDGVSCTTIALIADMESSMMLYPGQRSSIVSFTKLLLRALHYNQTDFWFGITYDVSPIICNKVKDAYLDLCLVSPADTIVMLAQADAPSEPENTKRYEAYLSEQLVAAGFPPSNVDASTSSKKDCEAQLIAGAIAAFQANNAVRMSQELEELEEMVFPGIVMTCARPTFYVIPVTRALNKAVVAGAYPTHVTRVTRCNVPSQNIAEGMEVLAYRRTALQYLVAFKTLAKDLWDKVLV